MDWVQHKAKTLSDKEVSEYWTQKAIPRFVLLHYFNLEKFGPEYEI